MSLTTKQFLRHGLVAIMTAGLTSIGGCATGSAPAGSSAYEKPEYLLAAGDRLRVFVFGEEELSQEYLVSSAGELAFPLIGNLNATGLSVDQLRGEIMETLSAGYIQDPRVTVEVLNYRPFYILGEVKKAGRYPVDDDLTAVQAIALAGGYTYRADERRLYITRSDSGREEEYDLRDERPLYVGPGDTIRIGERYF